MQKSRKISEGYVKKKTHFSGLICGIDAKHRDGQTIQFLSSGIISQINCKVCLKLYKKLLENV
jgi:hypothetical protein